ncbi:hypothetical protein U1Q18_049203 [Sarracenia purpurea var. burkii]
MKLRRRLVSCRWRGVGGVDAPKLSLEARALDSGMRQRLGPSSGHCEMKKKMDHSFNLFLPESTGIAATKLVVAFPTSGGPGCVAKETAERHGIKCRGGRHGGAVAVTMEWTSHI